MPGTKKTTSNEATAQKPKRLPKGVVPPERVEELKEQWQKLKSGKAQDRFLKQLSSEESYYLSLSMMDTERMRERLEMAGLLKAPVLATPAEWSSMPNAKKTNGHRNGKITPEHIESLKQHYLKLKTNKARDQFFEQMSLVEAHAVMVAMMDPEQMKERLTLAGLL